MIELAREGMTMLCVTHEMGSPARGRPRDLHGPRARSSSRTSRKRSSPIPENERTKAVPRPRSCITDRLALPTPKRGEWP